MKIEDCKIFIVDDDENVRRSLALLLRSAGYVTETFAGIGDFLASINYQGVGCILLDVFFKEETGLDLQEEIKYKFFHLPIIFITGHGDIPMSVKALKNGAINFLQKPVDDQLLLNAVAEAIKTSKANFFQTHESARIKLLFQKLTSRENDVFNLIITGLLNKQIAGKLNISENTVKIHRGRITEKLGVKSVAEMVHMAEMVNSRK